MSNHQTLLRWHLRRRTWTHECSETLDCKWVLKLDGRDWTFSGFSAGSAQTWVQVPWSRWGLSRPDAYWTVVPCLGVRFSWCAVQPWFVLLLQCSLTDLNASCMYMCKKTPVYYGFVCNIYCFVKAWRAKPVSPFLFFWRLMGLSSAVGVNK